MREDESEVLDAVYESLASSEWTPETLVRQRAECRLGKKLKHRQFSRAVVALLCKHQIEQRRGRRNGDAVLVMQYRRKRQED